jgi:hypothetical protein
MKLNERKRLLISSLWLQELGSTVPVSIPGVDKRSDARNRLPVVMEMAENYLRRLGTNDSILKQLYAVSRFSPCKTNRLNMGRVQTDRQSIC